MLLRMPILIFTLTLSFGIASSLLPTYIYEKFEPAFTGEEVEAMIGQRVREAYQNKFIAMQCPKITGKCSETKVGARGIIKDIRETSPNRYFIMVQWENDEGKEPMFSYCGRTTTRVSLEFENAD